MQHTLVSLRPSDVIIGERHRKVYKNIEELVDSINNQGLIHPPTLDANHRLIAGGRRMTALLRLEKDNPEKFGLVNFNIMQGEITPGTLRMLELTENVQREDMTWQEKVSNITEAHHLLTGEAAKKGERWVQEQTGRIFGVSKTSARNLIYLGEALKKGDKEVEECANPLEALRVLSSRIEDRGRAELIKRQGERAKAVAKGPQSHLEGATRVVPREGPIEDKGHSSPLHDASFEKSGETPLVESVKKPSPLPHLSDTYLLGDCLSLMDTLSSKVDAILTDPPYGIDMDNLTNTSRVAHTHDVTQNLELLPAFITKAYECLNDNGVLLMWYDLEHHNFLVNHAKSVGFKPCAWPLVWCKSSSCHNQAPQYNATKATEYVLVLRKGNYTLPKPIASNFLVSKNERNASHPFFKPIAVWEWLILNFTKQGDVVLDPFAGEGSCVLSLLLNKRLAIGMEIDINHYNKALTTIPSLYAGESAMRDVVDGFFS